MAECASPWAKSILGQVCWADFDAPHMGSGFAPFWSPLCACCYPSGALFIVLPALVQRMCSHKPSVRLTSKTCCPLWSWLIASRFISAGKDFLCSGLLGQCGRRLFRDDLAIKSKSNIPCVSLAGQTCGSMGSLTAPFQKCTSADCNPYFNLQTVLFQKVQIKMLKSTAMLITIVVSLSAIPKFRGNVPL